MEKRLLLAFGLSAAIFVGWSLLFPPPAPNPETAVAPPVAPAPATAGPTAQPEPASEAPEQAAAAPAAAPAEVGDATAAVAERTIRLESPELLVELTNRGAAIRSLVLRRYEDDEGRPLDLVQTVDLPERALPLQLVTPDGPDGALYTVERVEDGVRFRWSDGASSSVEKVVRLGAERFRIEVESRAQGAAASWPMAVGTGMRDIGAAEEENRFATWGDAVVLQSGEMERIKRKKVKEVRELPGAGVAFAGFEDTYFLNIFRPLSELRGVRIRPLRLPEKVSESDVKKDRKKKEDATVLQVLVVGGTQPVAGELFAAPKEYDLLQSVDAGVEETLHFGFFHPIAVIFLKVLRWIYGGVGNYGLAIILLTVCIRVLLFPLMHTSTVSMRKMQRLQPKVKAIQEKYKKHKSDPQSRAKMNQEMMELYKVEGVNPMGGCLPMLIQLPILWALYTLFAYAIELRHAPFIFWIADLSAKDPYYITPILMTASMWLQQKLAPQAGDPKQQRMFRMMPLIFGIMFLGFPSGLVLYWLANNVLTILQQEVTFHLMGERKPVAAKARGKK